MFGEQVEVINLKRDPFDQDFGHVLCPLCRILLFWKQGLGFGAKMSLTVEIC